MKIAHIVCRYPPYYSGMGNVVFEMASRLARRGHEIEVFTPQYETEDEWSAELQERADYARRLAPSLAYGNAARLAQIGRELDAFDLVHLHYPFFGTAGLVRRWKKNHPARPLVVTYHMDTRAPGWKGLFFRWYSAVWLPRILGSADALLASSFDFIASSQARQVFEANREKSYELPFGVDTQRFQPRERPNALLVRHQLSPDIPVVLFVGGMDEAHAFKGVPVLLDALLLLKRQGVAIQTVLVGDGNLRESYELRAIAYGLKDRVRFAGQVGDDELPYYYNLADLLVLPSLHQGEAFGMVLLEAMASGVPVVASDLPGVRTVAREAGEVVPAGDATALQIIIAQYFLNPEVQLGYQARAREVAVEKYDWEPIIGQLEGLYQSLLNR